MRVLLVEDNISAMLALKILIKPFGVQVIEAVDAETAYDLVTSQPFDLIITDVGLPLKQGDELTQMIRAFEKETGRKPVPVIGCTGHTAVELHQRYKDAGMNEVCIKPMNKDQLNILMNTYGHSVSLDAIAPIKADTSIKSSKQGNRIVNCQHTESGRGLGPDLPATEDELFQIDQFPILDLQVGIKVFEDSTLALDLIKSFRENGMPGYLSDLDNAYHAGNWGEIDRLAHKMKGAACYGTVRLAYALQYMERYIKAGHTNCLEKLYTQMIVTINETSNYLDRFFKISAAM